MIKRILFTLSAFGAISIGNAQQTATFDHYQTQQFLVNPAAAGLNGTSVILDYRRQWSGFAGAPETQVLAVDGAIKRDKIGLGLMIVNDQINILGSTSAMATFAYRVQFADNHFLRLGVSGGMNQNRILFDKVNAGDPSELQLFQDNQNATSFDANAGLFYELGNLKAGLAATHLAGGRYYYENNFDSQSLNYQMIKHYLLNAEYRFNIKKGKWAVVPAVQLRTAQGLKPLYEGGVTGFYKKDVWLTLRYLHNVGYTVAFGGFITKNILAGYAYSYSSTEISGYNQGTHDIILGFRFGSKNSTNGADQKAMDELRKSNSELYETTDFLKNQNEQLKKDMELQKKALKETIYGLDSIKKLMRNNKEELDKIIQENLKKLEKYQNPANSNETNSDNSNGNNTSGTNTGKGGTNNSSKNNSGEEIIDGKIYVVVGASVSLDVAKKFQRLVAREYGEETKIIKGAEGRWYFVYTKSFENSAAALKEQNRTTKLDVKNIFIGTPWCLVQNK
jgi:type IX secretion system PorP/SprF family membrane protein